MTDHQAGSQPPPWQGTPSPGPRRPCPYCSEPVMASAVLCRWCGNRLDRTPSPGTAALARRFASGIGLGLGGLLIGVSPVLPWLHVLLLGDVSLFEVARLGQGAPVPLVLLPAALVICGLTSIIAALVLQEGIAARATAIVLLATAAAIGGLLLAGLLKALAGAGELASIDIGPWIDLAGAFIMFWGVVVPPPPTTLARQSPTIIGRAVFAGAAFGVVVIFAALGITALANANDTSHNTASNSLSAPTTAMPSSQAPAATEPSTSTPPTIASALPPARSASPSAAADGGLAHAEALVWAKGYRPYPNTAWERPDGLQVIVGTVADSADGAANRAFFFYDGRYLGTDSTSDSAGVEEVWSDSDTVALSYQLYNAQDPMCCPTASAATVRYYWTGSRLIPLDPVPSDNPNASPSRR